MNFNEWLEHNGVIKTGFPYSVTFENLENVISERYWICDYRLNKNRDKKPNRNVHPKLVQVFSNNDLPKGKNVYYSPIHFREVKKGKVLSTVISPYDNTGYRIHPGVSVNIFDTELECNQFFRKQCDIAIAGYEEEIDLIQLRINDVRSLREVYGTD